MFFFELIEANPIGEWIRSAVITFYLLEMVHVIGISMLFGSLAIMDLRLVGAILRDIPVKETDRLSVVTWIGFALAAITGTLMFLSSVSIYVANTQFWLKMGVIVIAGANMILLEMATAKGAVQMGEAELIKRQRIAGFISLVAWCVVILLGRWIGFTKGVMDMDLPADFLLSL